MKKGWGVKIIGTGICLPGEPVTTEELSKRLNLEFDIAMVRDKIGIKTRHIAPDDIATSHIAAKAAQMALDNAGISAKQFYWELPLPIIPTRQPVVMYNFY